MVVTKTEAVTKSKYKVYIDGQFAFVLYKGELSRYHLQEGCEVSRELYDTVRKDVVLKRARLRALHLLNAMGRTESQLRTKLSQSDYPADVVEDAIRYVKSFGYIDDAMYARNYIDSRKMQKSRKEIYMQLLQKGIDKEEIEAAMEECYEKEDSVAAIQKLLEKKRFDPDQATPAEKQKIMAYLVRKGFGYEDIRRSIQVSEWNA